MLSDIEKRFRSGETLSCVDKEELKAIITNSDEVFKLQSALYLYGMSFKPDPSVVTAAGSFISDKKAPGLTATALKVLADFWGYSDKYLDILESYLHYNLYDDIWYDEVIVSASFFTRNPAFQTAAVNDKLIALAKEAEKRGDSQLLDLLNER